MRINNNIPSMQTQGALFMNNRSLSTDLERLSTGLRINRSSDDAAGLALAEGLRTQVRGDNQARRNALDGMSALNILDGALNEIQNIMQRQRELAVQSSTATYNNTERAFMQEEFNALHSELTRIANATNFNGIALFNSAGGAGYSAAFGTAEGFNGRSLHIGANDGVTTDRIRVDFAGLNTGSGLFGSAVGVGSAAGGTVLGDILTAGSAAGTAGGALNAITRLDAVMETVSTVRANIGSLVNRLESTITNLTVSATNQQAAESQIRDLDFAYQSASFTRNQIMSQSATAMLSQANAIPQSVLSLVR